MKYTIKSVFVIVGAIIGAGFASGKEIYIFFNRYGDIGILGIVVASLIIGAIIYNVLIQIDKTNVKGYDEYLEQINIRGMIKEVLNSIINIFLLISFYIMIAGFCAYFDQEFNISSIIVAPVVSLMCYITFMNNIEGITKINSILIPFLIIMIIIIGIKSDIMRKHNAEIICK